MKIKVWMNNLNIRKKIILYTYITIIPILVVISVYTFWDKYIESIQEQTQIHRSELKSLGNSIELLQTDMKNICTYISINENINKILCSDDRDTLNKDSRLWYRQAPMGTMQDIIALNGYVKTVGIYPKNGVFPFLNCMDYTSQLSYEQIQQTETFKEAVEKRGKMLWKAAGKAKSDFYEASQADKIVLCRAIFDLSKKNFLGYLMVGADASSFQNLCKDAMKQENECYVAINNEGEELFRYGTCEETIRNEMIDRLLEEKKTKVPEQMSVLGYHVFSAEGINDVVISKIVPDSNMHSPFVSIAIQPLLMLCGVLVGLFPVLVLVSNIVTKPLKKVCEAMKYFRKGDFQQQIEVTTMDEVGEVAACFNKMVKDTKALIDEHYVMEIKEKESELSLLQAQINPHFLYNTLDSLYWQAMDSDNEKIAEDILALSNLFRLVLGNGKRLIPVSHEMELIRLYLHIQKMRFNQRLEYTVEMEEGILDYTIPKLIIQPFVENVIVHGFEKIKGKCEILVTGKKDKDTMIFTIADTGKGMGQEQIDRIFQTEDSQNYKSQRIGRYGIKNIRERLELRYGDECRVHIESVPEKGTTVTLILPIKEV